VLTRADVDYIRANYFTLEELCASRKESPDEVSPLIRAGRLPRPAYVLDDGREMFPADYFVFGTRRAGTQGCGRRSSGGTPLPAGPERNSRPTGRGT
jgi:hypothetical protein